jgi:hypothetical protein
MSNGAVRSLVSFGIMVVAVLAHLSEKMKKLERRLTRREGPEDNDAS